MNTPGIAVIAIIVLAGLAAFIAFFMAEGEKKQRRDDRNKKSR